LRSLDFLLDLFHLLRQVGHALFRTSLDGLYLLEEPVEDKVENSKQENASSQIDE
jgi:hypothetical protein